MKIVDLDEFRAREPVDYPTAQWEGWTPYDRLAEENYRNLRALFADKPVHEDDFYFYGRFDGQPGLFLDVGANCGQSAVSLRNVNKSLDIVSFELLPLLGPVLERVRQDVPDFEFHICGAGSSEADAPVYVPVFLNLMCTPWASLDLTLFDDPSRMAGWRQITGHDEIEVVKLEAHIRPLDDFSFAPKFVKIDVESAELEALKGLRRTLERHQPPVMCERSDEPYVARYMASLGYRGYAYMADSKALVSLDLGVSPLNVFYVPETAKPMILAAGVAIQDA